MNRAGVISEYHNRELVLVTSRHSRRERIENQLNVKEEKQTLGRRENCMACC
jgi:hypothetical protein